MEELALAGDLAAATAQIGRFTRLLQARALEETVRLYVYLDHALAVDHPGRMAVRRARHSLEHLHGHAVGMMQRYTHSQPSVEYAAQFIADLESLAQMLIEHGRAEEHDLYPLYRPHPLPSAHADQRSTASSRQ